MKVTRVCLALYIVAFAFIFFDSFFFNILATLEVQEAFSYFDLTQPLNYNITSIQIPESMRESNTCVPEQEKSFPITPRMLAYQATFVYLIYMTGFVVRKSLSADEDKVKRSLIYTGLFFVLFTIAFYFIQEFNKSVCKNPTEEATTLLLLNLFSSISSPFYQIISVFTGLIVAYLIIRNYTKVKRVFYEKPLAKLSSFVQQDSSRRKDLWHFIVLSLIVVFLADVMFIATGAQDILEFIPGLGEYSTIMPKENAPTIGNVTSKFGYLPGPGIGIFIVFIMRQFRYREEYKKSNNTVKDSEKKDIEEKYPGTRILYLFIFVVSAILIMDAYSIWQGTSESRELPRDTDVKEKPVHVILKLADDFIFRYVLGIWYTVLISAVTWMFDWHIFSQLWKRFKEKEVN